MASRASAFYLEVKSLPVANESPSGQHVPARHVPLPA